jgi:DNA polymerase-3 subunit delta'
LAKGQSTVLTHHRPGKDTMSWDQIRGHDSAIRFFATASKQGRIGHAYLFVGPDGVGKRTFARELAKALLCDHSAPDRLEACGRCPACHQAAAGTHPDQFVAARLEEKQELTIDVVRELCASLGLKPMRGGRKVAILEDADDLNADASNAFLKTLEEPPPRSVLILIGGPLAETQLPTIVSRCQIVRFAPLAPSALTELLHKQGVTDPALVRRSIRLSAGSIGQALALTDESLWRFRETLLQALGSTRLDSVKLGTSWQQFVEEAKDSAAQRRRASLLVRMVIETLQLALRVSTGEVPEGLDPAEAKVVQALAQRLGTEKLLAWIERALEADAQIVWKVQLALILEAFAAFSGQLTTPPAR